MPDLLATLGGQLDRGRPTPVGQAARLHQGFLWLMDDENLSDQLSGRTTGHPSAGYDDDRLNEFETQLDQWLRFAGSRIIPPMLEGMI